jgi:hypothetical protein
MKNQIVFLLLSLFAFSCSDETPVTLQEQVLGEWQVNSFVINSCPDVSENLPLTLANDDGCLDVMGDRTCMSIFILENGQAELKDEANMSSEEVDIMTYELNETNNTITICQDSDDCVIFTMRENGLYNEMDEDGCICVLGFKKM